MTQVVIPRNPRPARRFSLIWQMIALAVVVHAVVLAVASPSWFKPGQTPEQTYQLGENALSEGKYAEAMQYFQKVLEQQPKPPPVFEKAAEQHRVAERLSKQAAAKAAPSKDDSTADKPSDVKVKVVTDQPKPTQPAKVTPKPPVKNGDDFVPPELRGTK